MTSAVARVDFQHLLQLGDRLVVHLLPEEEVGDVHRFLDLTCAFGERLSHFNGDQQPQQFLFLKQLGTDLADYLAPSGRWNL